MLSWTSSIQPTSDRISVKIIASQKVFNPVAKIRPLGWSIVCDLMFEGGKNVINVKDDKGPDIWDHYHKKIAQDNKRVWRYKCRRSSANILREIWISVNCRIVHGEPSVEIRKVNAAKIGFGFPTQRATTKSLVGFAHRTAAIIPD